MLEPGSKGWRGIGGRDPRRVEHGRPPLVRRLDAWAARWGREDHQGARGLGSGDRLLPGRPRHLAGPEAAFVRRIRRKADRRARALAGREIRIPSWGDDYTAPGSRIRTE